MFNLLSIAYAQDASKVAQPSALASLMPFALIFLIFYFLMIRPQKKRLQEEQNMLNGLSNGDEVYTKSGVLGKVVGLNEKIVTLEVSEGVKVKYLRSQIGGLSGKLFQPKVKDKK